MNERVDKAAARPPGFAPRRHRDPHARLRGAALELFATNGYQSTTVDAIAQLAGMSRRTFFRYFSSKEDAIFPDHDSLLVEVEARLGAMSSGSPVEAVCAAMHTVFESYLTDHDVALERYQLTHTIPTLRDREIASVSRYQRLLTSYLGSRYGRSAKGALQAELVAAAVIAAHNHVLRRWLRRGCTGRPRVDLDRAFEYVCSTFEPAAPPDRLGDQARSDDCDPATIAVFRSSLPLAEITEAIARLADEADPLDPDGTAV
ncbi:MAG: TetR family transcriptional regulator [Propionibacteriales bacterium]|nr:TetR family transcriptional regulator [Propionibacteriales bacterium]